MTNLPVINEDEEEDSNSREDFVILQDQSVQKIEFYQKDDKDSDKENDSDDEFDNLSDLIGMESEISNLSTVSLPAKYDLELGLPTKSKSLIDGPSEDKVS